ncbi:hypothetical protein Bhyg_06957 [Pseudolycoriella hygida]|uniref:Uncharacterized protein n=1 Tax=Pseudolycoriella hygida TaxID=35572 RepID=A0A9Q0N2Q7_9DIPT|nr:hypothetical protein Bhyg_06957 [Pseudolycoriella hygida]
MSFVVVVCRSIEPEIDSMGKCVSKQTTNSSWELDHSDCGAVSERSFVLLLENETATTQSSTYDGLYIVSGALNIPLVQQRALTPTQ